MVESDRRAYARIEDEGLSIKLQSEEFDTVTHTLNMSASGIYCKVDRQIPLMSRVKLVLMVPGSSKGEKVTQGMEVDGVVVREHPVVINNQIKHYDVAIFFDNLSEKNREAISGYIASKKG